MGLLIDLGYSDVRHYPGGLAEWTQNSSQRPDVVVPAVGIARDGVRPRRLVDRTWSLRFLDALTDRSVGELFRLWTVIVVICGTAYWLAGWTPTHALTINGKPIGRDAGGLLSALYFSAITATSVGYGDIAPTGAARLLAIVESITGLVIFGCLVSKFVSRRQEELIGEIHRIAYEDRLGRVRTNLHLVRTEVQAATRLCEGQAIAPPAALSRVESISMVFVGELRAVHDLLYRPQQRVDEAVLEAILANLASVFRELNDLLLCVDSQRGDRPPALRTSLATMERLAREICGECVPREYAPELRSWMDEIQRIAGAAAQI